MEALVEEELKIVDANSGAKSVIMDSTTRSCTSSCSLIKAMESVSQTPSKTPSLT